MMDAIKELISPMKGPGICDLNHWKFAGLCDGQIFGGFQGREVEAKPIAESGLSPKFHVQRRELIQNGTLWRKRS